MTEHPSSILTHIRKCTAAAIMKGVIEGSIATRSAAHQQEDTLRSACSSTTDGEEFLLSSQDTIKVLLLVGCDFIGLTLC